MIAWTVVRAFGLDRIYPVVPLLAFTPYVALLGVLATGVALLLRRPLPAVAIGLSSLALIALVAPRAFPGDPPDPRPTGPELTVISANLLIGDADIDDLARQVRDGGVDVLSVAELTPEADREIGLSEIGELLPYRAANPLLGSSGTGLYSRYPLEPLPAPGVAGHDLPTVVASAALPGGGTAEIYSIHPLPPNGSANVSGIESYLNAIPDAGTSGPPQLLVGDFNTTLDNSALRDLLDRGYADAADADGSGLSWTWPQRLYPPPVTIDHSLVDERVEVLDVETQALEGSDHRTVTAALRLP